VVQVQVDPTTGRQPAASRVNARLWIGVLVAGAAAVFVYDATLSTPNLNAIAYLAADALAVVAIFAAVLLNRPARPRARPP
jgi:hypothetical protein